MLIEGVLVGWSSVHRRYNKVVTSMFTFWCRQYSREISLRWLINPENLQRGSTYSCCGAVVDYMRLRIYPPMCYDNIAKCFAEKTALTSHHITITYEVFEEFFNFVELFECSKFWRIFCFYTTCNVKITFHK